MVAFRNSLVSLYIHSSTSSGNVFKLSGSKMITVSAGIFLGESDEERAPKEDLKWIREWHGEVHLGFFRYNTYLAWREEALKIMDKVTSIHMPSKFPSSNEIYEFIDFFGKTRWYVIHPNRSVVKQLREIYEADRTFKICIENFPWSAKKTLRSPIDIVKFAAMYGWEFCFDTCHAEAVWLENYMAFKPLALSASIIHLSNRMAEPQRLEHIPINKGDVHINKILSWLRELQWEGEVVLEYMPKFRNRFSKDIEYVRRRLGL